MERFFLGWSLLCLLAGCQFDKAPPFAGFPPEEVIESAELAQQIPLPTAGTWETFLVTEAPPSAQEVARSLDEAAVSLAEQHEGVPASVVRERIRDQVIAVSDHLLAEDEQARDGAAASGVVVGEVAGGNRRMVSELPHSLGIRVLENGVPRVAFLLRKGVQLPTEVSDTFRTSADDQTAIRVTVLEGESETPRDNEELGAFSVEGLPKRAQGLVQVRVTFSVDAFGQVAVRAEQVDGNAGGETKVEVDGAPGAEAPASPDDTVEPERPAPAPLKEARRERIQRVRDAAASAPPLEDESLGQALHTREDDYHAALCKRAKAILPKMFKDDACTLNSKAIEQFLAKKAGHMLGAQMCRAAEAAARSHSNKPEASLAACAQVSPILCDAFAGDSVDGRQMKKEAKALVQCIKEAMSSGTGRRIVGRELLAHLKKRALRTAIKDLKKAVKPKELLASLACSYVAPKVGEALRKNPDAIPGVSEDVSTFVGTCMQAAPDICDMAAGSIDLGKLFPGDETVSQTVALTIAEMGLEAACQTGGKVSSVACGVISKSTGWIVDALVEGKSNPLANCLRTPEMGAYVGKLYAEWQHGTPEEDFDVGLSTAARATAAFLVRAWQGKDDHAFFREPAPPAGQSGTLYFEQSRDYCVCESVCYADMPWWRRDRALSAAVHRYSVTFPGGAGSRYCENREGKYLNQPYMETWDGHPVYEYFESCKQVRLFSESAPPESHSRVYLRPHGESRSGALRTFPDRGNQPVCGNARGIRRK